MHPTKNLVARAAHHGDTTVVGADPGFGRVRMGSTWLSEGPCAQPSGIDRGAAAP